MWSCAALTGWAVGGHLPVTLDPFHRLGVRLRAGTFAAGDALTLSRPVSPNSRVIRGELVPALAVRPPYSLVAVGAVALSIAHVG